MKLTEEQIDEIKRIKNVPVVAHEPKTLLYAKLMAAREHIQILLDSNEAWRSEAMRMSE